MVSPSKYDYFGYPLSMLVFGGTTPSFQKVFEEWDCSFCQNYIWGLLFIDPVTWLIWLEIQVSCLNMSPFETNIWQDLAWCSLFCWWTPSYPRTLQVFPSYNWPTKNTFQQKTPSKANNLRRNPCFFSAGFLYISILDDERVQHYQNLLRLFWSQRFYLNSLLVLLMGEILHHLGCIKPCKKWDNLPINWLAGFLPTVWQLHGVFFGSFANSPRFRCVKWAGPFCVMWISVPIKDSRSHHDGLKMWWFSGRAREELWIEKMFIIVLVTF